MIAILVLTALGIVAFVATMVELRRDGYHRVPNDPARHP
jgi:hypothetical protein